MRRKPDLKIKTLKYDDTEGKTTDESSVDIDGIIDELSLSSEGSDSEYEFSLSPQQEREIKERNYNMAMQLCELIPQISEEEYRGLFARKIKADVLKIILDNINGKVLEGMTRLVPSGNCAPSLKEMVEDAYLDAKIGGVKYRDFVRVQKKVEGVSAGEFVVKAADDSVEPSLKHKYKWVNKISSNKGKDIGEEICEYVGTNLMNYLLGDNSPKIRLLKNQAGEVSLGVKFLNNFKTYDACNRDERYDIEDKIESGELKGLAEFYIANMILADYDNNPGNFGFITNEQGDISIARIDHGKIFSYRTIKKTSDEEMMQWAIDKKLTIEQAQQMKYSDDYSLSNIRAKVFPNKFFKRENLFEGTEFSQKVCDVIEKIDLGFMTKIIDRSIENIKEAYGANIFLDEKVRVTLAERLMIPAPAINEAIFKDTIIDNMLQVGTKIQESARENDLPAVARENKRPISAVKSWVEEVEQSKTRSRDNSPKKYS